MHGAWYPRGRGQALVELAVISPLLLLTLLGTLDLGRIFYYQVTVNNAAREAARYGSMFPGDVADIQAHAQAEAAPVAIPSGDIVVSTPSGPTPGNVIQVAVTYHFQAITPLISRIWGGGTLAIQGEAKMVIQ